MKRLIKVIVDLMAQIFISPFLIMLWGTIISRSYSVDQWCAAAVLAIIGGVYIALKYNEQN